jgi:CheY-like chemotaxis protein
LLWDTSLIALSGYGSRADRERSRAAGIDEHLLKPVDPEVIRRLLLVLGHLADPWRAR